MKTIRTLCNAAIVGTLLLGVLTIGTAAVHAATHGDDGGSAALIHKASDAGGSALANGAPYYAIAFTMGIACLSAAYAVGKVGAAALGAAAEKPELLGKAIVFVGLGEGIAIFGLIISLMLINKL